MPLLQAYVSGWPLERAELRIKDGTFGYSIQSGVPIPDARLEADPAAELTVEEAQQT